MKCKSCGTDISTITLLRGALEEDLCNKCFMMKRTDRDRRGRHSKIDKNKDKYEREMCY